MAVIQIQELTLDFAVGGNPTPRLSIDASGNVTIPGITTMPAHVSPITIDTDAATVVFHLSVSDWHQVTLGNNRTLAVVGAQIGQQFTVALTQDGTGSRTVTWFAGILWTGGSAPTLTTTASKTDVFTFKCVSAGVFWGFIAGQNI